MVTIELIVFLIASVLIGVLLGFLLFLFGRDPKLPDFSVNLGAGSEGGDEISDDLFRIFQRGVGYPLLIEVGDRRYRDIGDIENEGNRALILTAMRKMLSQVSPEELAGIELEEEPAEVATSPTPTEGASPATTAAQSSGNGSSQRADSPYFLVNEIDDLFQAVLETMPDVPEASIAPAPDGSMRITFDGQVYDDVNAVPNQKVQEALRTAVRRWESRI